RVVRKAFAGPVGRGPRQHEGGAWRHGGGGGPVALGSRVVRDASGAETIVGEVFGEGGGGGFGRVGRVGSRLIGREISEEGGVRYGEGGGGGRGIAVDVTSTSQEAHKLNAPHYGHFPGYKFRRGFSVPFRLSIEVSRFTTFHSFWFNIKSQTVPVIRMNLLSVILALLAIIVGSVNAVKLIPGRIQPPRVQIENVRYARSPVGIDHARSLGQFPGSQSVRLVRKALADSGDGQHGIEFEHRGGDNVPDTLGRGLVSGVPGGEAIGGAGGVKLLDVLREGQGGGGRGRGGGRGGGRGREITDGLLGKGSVLDGTVL
ncbi:unnamed protein product, partial [Allacma fusca]